MKDGMTSSLMQEQIVDPTYFNTHPSDGETSIRPMDKKEVINNSKTGEQPISQIPTS